LTGGAAALPRAAGEEPASWSPLDDPDEDVLPWFAWLGAFTPLTMLAFVRIEPIAIAVAIALVVLALLIATRRLWSRLSRITGIASLTLLGLGLSTAVSLYAQGSFAKISFRRIITGPPPPPVIDLADAEWNPVTSTELNFGILFPGKVVKSDVVEPYGTDIAQYQAKFPKEGVTFALQTFRISNATLNEAGEAALMQRVHAIVRWLFAEGDGQHAENVFYFAHPGLEYRFEVAGSTTTILCRAFLVRDRAYLVSVTADAMAKVKPAAETFLASFRLLESPPRLRGLQVSEPDWKALGRPPIPLLRPTATFRGHFQPPLTLLAFTADGKSLLTGADRESAVLWDIATGHGSTLANTEEYPFFAIDPTGASLVAPMPAAAPNEFAIRAVALRNKAPALGPADTDHICFAPDAKTAYVALDASLTAWPLDGGEMLWRRTAGKTPIACQAIAPDGVWLATAALNELTVSLWDAKKNGADVAKWTAAEKAGPIPIQIQQIAFAPDGKSLATCSLDQKVRIWKLDDPSQPKLAAIMIQEAPVTCIDFSRKGDRLATGDLAGVVRVWDVATGKLLSEFRASDDGQKLRLLRFSPNDAKLAVALELGQLRGGVNLYDVARLPPESGSPSIAFLFTDEPPLLEEPEEKE
jgi:hypothetical protein